MTTVIQAKNLSKRYGRQLALDGLGLEVRQGEIFGFLGPNGAGKTTFVKLLLGFVRPTSGSLEILGSEPARLDRSQIGYLPEKIVIQTFLSGYEYLLYQGRLNGIPKDLLEKQVENALARVEMTEAAHRRIAEYSKGMVQRIGLANLLIGERRLLLLDEPNSGLDPMGQALVRNLMLELRKEGKTVFFNSHQLLEVEKISDRVAILNRGRVMAEGSQSDLSSQRGISLELSEMNDSLKKLFRQADAGAEISGTRVRLQIDDSEEERLLPKRIVECGGRILSYSQSTESLEDVFARLVKAG